MAFAKIPFDLEDAGNNLTSDDVIQFDSSAGTLSLATSGTHPTGASAIFQATSTTQGVIIPYMDTAQRDAISVPANGMMIVNSENFAISTYAGAWYDYQTLLFGADTLDWSGIFASPITGNVYTIKYAIEGTFSSSERIKLNFQSVIGVATTAAILTSTALDTVFRPAVDQYFTLPIITDDTLLKSAVIKIATSGVITIGIQSAIPLLTQGLYLGTSALGNSGFRNFIVEYDANGS